MSGQHPTRVTISTATIAKISSLKELIRRVNQEIASRETNLQSPKDIEALFTYDLNFITLLGHKFDEASSEEKAAYATLGFKPSELQLLREDQAIAQSWIDWYKHERLREIEVIKAIEDLIPTCPEFKIASSGHPGSNNWALFTNTRVPELKLRLRQAAQYSRALFNIFGAPHPAPAPGNPLPTDLPVPDLGAPAPCRSPYRSYIFSTRKTYGEECGKIVNLFLQAAVRDGTLSDLLPFVPRIDSEWPQQPCGTAFVTLPSRSLF